MKEPQLDAGEKIRTKLITFDDLLLLPQESRFWVTPEFINYLLHVQSDENKKTEFRKLLFPS